MLIWRYFAQKNGYAGGRHHANSTSSAIANPNVPVLFFTHDNYLKDFAGHDRKADLYGNSRVVLLVRDPRDTAVSQFFQWKHRIVPPQEGDQRLSAGRTMDLSRLHHRRAVGHPQDHRLHECLGQRDRPHMPNLLVVKYEDLRADTKGQLAPRAAISSAQPPTDAELDDAVSFASIDNMRRMELENAEQGRPPTRSLKPGDANDPSSFKVRRAKVGGWRDYVTEEQAAAIDRMVKETLDPVFGYE